MGLWDKLSNARNYVRKSRGPDSYFQYKRKRDHQRREAEEGRERVRDTAERERGEAKRGRDYDERYTTDRQSDITGEPTQRDEETKPGP